MGGVCGILGSIGLNTRDLKQIRRDEACLASSIVHEGEEGRLNE